MTLTETSAIEREVRIRARPETIFAFFTDPELMVRWKGRSATLEPTPGGIYRVDINGEHVARGEYVEISPPHRVVFTWGWEAGDSPISPGASTVEVTLTPDGDDTVVRLIHRDLPSKESANSHAAGWEHYLERLEIVGGGGDPGPDPWGQRAMAEADQA
jgi:uncharacterized protein YndB with AHSA1/START domain